MQPAQLEFPVVDDRQPFGPRRIATISHSMGAGGAERLVSILAREWASLGRDVTVITIESRDEDFYELPDSVHRVGLGLSGGSSGLCQAVLSNWCRINTLRHHIRISGAEAVVSFVDNSNLLTLLATAISWRRPRVVVCEQVHPLHHPIGRGRSYSRRLLYPRADAVVVQTDEIRGWVQRHVPGAKLHVIPNPVPPCQGGADAIDLDIDGPAVVAMGRLVPQKGFDLLLRAFAHCASWHPRWLLLIIGEGPEEKRLRALASHLRVGDRLRLLGIVKNPHAVLHRAELFVLSSRFEGMPNALLEAMACGLPAVAFDCPSGPAEVIRHEVDGLLVPREDVVALAGALDRLMSDESERKRLASRAREVVERFSVRRIVRMWDHVLARVTEP